MSAADGSTSSRPWLRRDYATRRTISATCRFGQRVSGLYVNASGQSRCSTCQNGTYSAAISNATCTSCSVPMYTFAAPQCPCFALSCRHRHPTCDEPSVSDPPEPKQSERVEQTGAVSFNSLCEGCSLEIKKSVSIWECIFYLPYKFQILDRPVSCLHFGG